MADASLCHFSSISRSSIINLVIRKIIEVLGDKILNAFKQGVRFFLVKKAQLLLNLYLPLAVTNIIISVHYIRRLKSFIQDHLSLYYLPFAPQRKVGCEASRRPNSSGYRNIHHPSLLEAPSALT
ncbi:hypothetical protein GGX14DRAFT_407596 [Mycena pura]|uniref:Uncharacterized protein n=1 Tax=Mycena pura TaxID=153505 RepID=A0AAD6XWY4_9AGAR|nr:hypothetical protein GGX14DRAFT_407596 [Mycena pura]